MAKSLKDWYEGAVSNKPQTVEYLLPRMALSLVSPHHQDSLRYSCHLLATREIGRLHNEDELTDDHEIIMLGLGPTVYHTILAYKDKVIFDSDNPGTEERFDFTIDKYHSQQWKGTLNVMHRMPVRDFIHDYAEKIIQPGPPTPSRPEPAL